MVRLWPNLGFFLSRKVGQLTIKFGQDLTIENVSFPKVVVGNCFETIVKNKVFIEACLKNRIGKPKKQILTFLKQGVVKKHFVPTPDLNQKRAFSNTTKQETRAKKQQQNNQNMKKREFKKGGLRNGFEKIDVHRGENKKTKKLKIEWEEKGNKEKQKRIKEDEILKGKKEMNKERRRKRQKQRLHFKKGILGQKDPKHCKIAWNCFVSLQQKTPPPQKNKQKDKKQKETKTKQQKTQEQRKQTCYPNMFFNLFAKLSEPPPPKKKKTRGNLTKNWTNKISAYFGEKCSVGSLFLQCCVLMDNEPQNLLKPYLYSVFCFKNKKHCCFWKPSFCTSFQKASFAKVADDSQQKRNHTTLIWWKMAWPI